MTAISAVLKSLASTKAVSRQPITTGEIDGGKVDRDPSFTDRIPWIEYDHDAKCFLFDDAASVGAVFELTPMDVDGRPMEQLVKLQDGIAKALHAIPSYRKNPWIVQFYIQDEPIRTRQFIDGLYQYAKPDARDSAYTKHFFDVLEKHIDQACRKGGMFFDEGAGVRWKGRMRRVRATLYRRSTVKDWPQNNRYSDEDLQDVKQRFVAALNKSGIKSTEYTDKELYEWLMPWVTPRPTGFKNGYDLLEAQRFKSAGDDAVAEFDLARIITKRKPRSGPPQSGMWYFCDQPHRYLTLEGISVPPRPGHWTTEEKTGDTSVALFDDMPEGTILAMTIVIESQADIKEHLTRMKKRAAGGSADAGAAAQQATEAEHELAHAKRMYRMSHGIYLTAENDTQLDIITTQTIAKLRSADFDPIEIEDDIIAQDSYLHNLPMCYRPAHAKKALRGRLTYSHHIARLIPLFGRGIGTGNPGLFFFNRCGQPMLFDPINKRDRKKTAHGLLFGPTGAGKSATLNYINMLKMAIYNPRLFIIEAGNSFGLLGEEFKRWGKTVEHKRFTAKGDVKINPFANADKAFKEQQDNIDLLTEWTPASTTKDGTGAKLSDEQLTDALDSELIDEEEESRDYLGEMERIALLMVTGAQAQEEIKVSRQDRMTVRQAIILGAKHVVEAAGPDGDHEVIVEEVCAALDELAQEEGIGEIRRNRIKEMADGMRIYTQGLHGKIFNHKCGPWPEADVTIVDLGIIAGESYQDILAVCLISLLYIISNIGEKYQYDDRYTEVNTDEGHIITTNPTLVKPFVYGVKTWRKLGIWLTQGTQNLDDYPDEAAKMLNLAEWWYCLVMPIKEIEDISRFKRLSDEQKALLEDTRKEPPKYTEGVVLSDTMTTAFRVVMPALPLALAQTDQEEKAHRRSIMNERGLASELDAAYAIADQIYESREKSANDNA